MTSWIFAILLLTQWMVDKPTYQVFGRTGKGISYDSMITELSKADVVLFGEVHNNALVHWLELQVAKDLHARDSNLVVGLEMLEADNQLVVDEYLAGTIQQRHFMQEAKIWDNYSTDYEPIVEFAKKHNVPVVATNIPRRYASLVSREGIAQLGSLTDQAKHWIAPLPIKIDTTLPGYQNMLTMMGGSSGHGGMNGKNMVQAQAIKDATMAHFIHQNIEGEKIFLHINGSYHSDNFEGIYWYLQQKSPELTIKTISCVEQTDLDSLMEENQQLADFIIVTPEDMTRTY